MHDVSKSVAFDEKVFEACPQKQVTDYAKFDLKRLALNFSLASSTGEVSAVDHLGIEVETVKEIAEWKARQQREGVLEKVEDNIACCFARQDKLWFTDPDGNAWEIFTVHEQLAVTGSLSQRGCCVPKEAGEATGNSCRTGR